MEHPIQGLMKTAMESIKGMVDVNTVVGEAVQTPDGTVIIPVSRVSLGFAAGGGEYGWEKNGRLRDEVNNPLAFGGGSGAGVSVQPVGFLVVSSNSVRLLPVDEKASLERIIDLAPEFIEKIQALFKSNSRNNGRARYDDMDTSVEYQSDTLKSTPIGDDDFGFDQS